MDPSCTIGFLCRTLNDLIALRKEAEKVLAPPLQKGVYLFFSFSDSRLSEVLDISVDTHMVSNDDLTCDGFVMEGTATGDSSKKKKKNAEYSFEDFSMNEDEDFVVVECRHTSSSGDSTPKLESNNPPGESTDLSSTSALQQVVATDF